MIEIISILGANPVGKKVCDCSIHHGPIRKYDEKACRWILLVAPSCHPVLQHSNKSGNLPGFHQAGSFRYEQNFPQQTYSNFQQFQPPQFNVQYMQSNSQVMPRAYPLFQPVSRENSMLARRESRDESESSGWSSDRLCEPVDMPCHGNGIFVHGTICKTKCPLRGEVERRKCTCRKNECYWKIIRKCSFPNQQPLQNRSLPATDQSVQPISTGQAVEEVETLGFNQISVLKVATGFKDQLLAAFQDLCSRKGQSCLFTFNET